jgi:hypothetical protein
MSVLQPPWQLRQTLLSTVVPAGSSFVTLTLLSSPSSTYRHAMNFEAYQNLPSLAIDGTPALCQ